MVLDVLYVHAKKTDDGGNTLQHAATFSNTLQHAATRCNMLQHAATHCSILNYAATYTRAVKKDDG